MAPHQSRSRETLMIRQVPQKASNGEQDVFSDFEKLIFSPGPFPSWDELNYNDGLEANPFDKIAKVYGRHKGLFLFNSILQNEESKGRILEICEKKCEGLQDAVELMSQFKKRMNVYLKRMRGGGDDAKEVLGGLEGFFHGCYFAKRGQNRNIHANLNINVVSAGERVETKKLLSDLMTGRMEAENSKLERLKIYGNSKRIMNVVKGVNGQRSYTFSKLAKMDLEIEWIGRDNKTEHEVVCGLVLELNGGRIRVKMASLDGVNGEGSKMMMPILKEYALQNNDILIRNKTLSKVLEEIESFTAAKDVDAAMKDTTTSSGGSGKRLICMSKEKLTVIQLTEKPKVLDDDEPMEKADFKELLADIEKLKFTSEGPFDPDDKLNYNDGRVDVNPFIKLRKYHGRYKNIFVLLGYLCDDNARNEIMNVVRRKCGEGDAGAQRVLDFEKRIAIFLDKIEEGKKQAMEFLGEEGSRDVAAFLSGPYVPDENRKVLTNLNIDLLGENHWKAFPTSEYLDNSANTLPEMRGVEKVKIFGNGKKIATVSKKGIIGGGGGQRNYILTKFAKMTLEVEWKSAATGKKDENEDSPGDEGNDKQCKIILNIQLGSEEKNGITISKAFLDGKTVDAADMAVLVKENDAVFLRNKPLYDVMYPKMDGKEDERGRGNTGALNENQMMIDDDDEFEVLDGSGMKVVVGTGMND